ncbi:MAG: hypothetical protein RR584_11515, partial [Comamonas sp.]
MSTTVQIDENAQRLMSAEELLALQEDYNPDADDEAALAAAQPSKNGDGDGDGQDAAAAVVTDVSGAKTEPEPEPEPEQAAPAPYVVDLPADYEAQVQANKQARKELREKFNNGDLDSAEFDEQAERLDDQHVALISQKQRADIAAEMSEQAAQNAWLGTINTFISEVAKSDKIDYRTDTAKQADLDTFVKLLGAKEANKPMRWYLDEAHKRVLALHGMSAPATPAAKAADTQRRPNVQAVAPNLSEVSGAGGTDPMDDQFAAIDKLEGLEA